MFKKIALLSSIILGLPFALCIAEASNSFAIAFAQEEERGEYHGYTYTQVGNKRYYDTTELTPKIVKNFWAPNGYKFTLNFSDSQINEILDQSDALGNHYSYVMLNLSYNKYGMNIGIENFSNSFDSREECFDFIKDKVNNYQSFYELENIEAETELSIDLSFYFSGELTSYTFYFSGEEEIISPVDQTSFIEARVTYDDGVIEPTPKIWIYVDPLNGFFNEEPLNNQFGYKTTETQGRYVYDPETKEYNYYDNCAVFTVKLYAYGSVEIADASNGFVEVTYPSRPLPIKPKLEFDSGTTHYSFWGKEFTIGEPNFHVTVDGFDDRESVQVDTKHEYALDFDNYSEEKINSIDVSATIEPIRIKKNDKLVEYYDLAVEPEKSSDFSLRCDTFGFFTDSYQNSLSPINNPVYEYVIRNVPLYVDNEVFISNKGEKSYYNHSTYEGCHYRIEYGDSTYMEEEGVYDIYFDVDSTSDNFFKFELISPISISSKYFLNVNGNNVRELSKDDLNQLDQYTLNVDLNEGDDISIIDNDNNRIVNTSNWECSNFTLSADGHMKVVRSGKYDIRFNVYSSTGSNIVFKSRPLPEVGEEGLIYYIASSEEVRLHHQGRDEEFLDKPYGGQYAVVNHETGRFSSFEGIKLFEFDSSKYLGEEDLLSLAKGEKDIEFIGDWTISLSAKITSDHYEYGTIKKVQKLEVSTRDKSGDYIVLNSSLTNEELPDEVNLLNGGDKLEIIPTIPSYQEGIKYYHTHEVEKEGIVDVEEKEDGRLLLTTLNPGVTSITFEVECELFPTITKTISVRVLDAIYDVAKIAVPDEFHYAGKDLTASISIRGFTRIQNIDVSWDVTNKKGEKIDNNQLVVKRDATITLKNTDSDDYTFTAYYEGVKLDTLTVQVRYTDLNSFLRVNVWWIFFITIVFLGFVIFLNKVLSRGRTTVEHIEKAYQVYCQCLSDDKLTLIELKTIKKSITKCLHRCEDLNIEALNQYEKAIRYLRKSVIDCSALIKKWQTITVEDKSVFIEKLNADLNKALSVAKEIETAKEISEQYHEKANRQNYEKVVEEKPSKKDK